MCSALTPDEVGLIFRVTQLASSAQQTSKCYLFQQQVLSITSFLLTTAD